MTLPMGRRVQFRGQRVWVSLVALIVVAAAAVAVAQPEPPSGAERMVARVADHVVTVGELQRRLALVPPFQLRVLGSTPDEIRRAYLEQLIEQQLLAQGAKAEGLDRRADVRSRVRAVLRAAMLEHVRQEVGDGSDVDADAVAAYYREHEGTYRSEKLLKLWQIVVPTRKEALAVLDVIKNDASYAEDPVKGWTELAKKHSVDETTKANKGNLDFVHPDGTTKRLGVKINPALYQAAEGVGDGEVVPEPIQDGSRFVIVQRRGTRQTPERTLKAEGPAIRRKLAQKHYQDRVEQLKQELRRTKNPEIHAERIDTLEISQLDGRIEPARRPGGLPRSRHPATGSPRPEGQPGFLR